MRHWLMKSEPASFSIADLKKAKRTHWDGVRNYQARNAMQEMAVGDLVLFYHSNGDPPGVAGVAKVCRTAYPDPTAFDCRDPHFDPKSNPEKPTWFMVDVEFVERFPTFVTLDGLKEAKALQGMLLTSGKAMRLSVQPVEKRHFDAIRKMGRA
ncbi:MAG: EVE domain-containing protein [Thermoplasmatota archaeon]